MEIETSRRLAIKLRHANTMRTLRFDSTTTWADLTALMRRLYSLPNDAKLTVSYKDHEGHTITIDPTTELGRFTKMKNINIRWIKPASTQ